MLMTLTLLSFVSQIPSGIALFHACIPNSQFRLNGRLCACDAMGRWSEASCQSVRRQTCTPGQIIWEDCNQCICQETGNLICANMCPDDTKLTQITKSIDVSIIWCIPFVSYYVNCSLCVCPASGNLNNARCATDSSCPFRGSIDYLATIRTQICIPKVMYIFPCLRCLCSDEGLFIIKKCVETCQKTARADEPRRCSPRKFFRKGCNICFCPDNAIVSERLCTKNECVGVQFQSLTALRNKRRKCLREMFTGPKCLYCECGPNGAPNENACLETDCMGIDNLNYNFETLKCSPGELILNCMDCWCLRNGVTDIKYCTKICANEQKLVVLQSAIKDSFTSHHILNRINIPDKEGDVCEPNSIYKEQGKYCLCSENGETHLNVCTSVFSEVEGKTSMNLRGPSISIDLNAKCDPNTFIEFDCNTCYCSKTGRIDANWCTYDDCAAKRLTIETNRLNYKPVDTSITDCVAGAMSKVECNYCICPENGKYKDKVCTKNSCAGIKSLRNEFTCEPLAYYTVDCNICFCPKNGIKNIDKCTKHTCETNFLRSEACVPGRLFSNECNVCVCPPNGNKADKICTNNTCEDADTPWKKIFKLSQSLLSYQVDDATRNLELCFPGEEFEVGCKVCLCPDMGLRAYATCTEMLCNDRKVSEEVKGELISTPLHRIRRNYDCNMCLDQRNRGGPDMLRRSNDECKMCFLVDKNTRNKVCTPGSMYIIRCKQCICPYMGNIDSFCRPMPDDTYCEQAFPNIDYMPMGRRADNGSMSNLTETSQAPTKSLTSWKCDKPGRVMDACFICECADGFIIKEHCFHSDSQLCTHAEPTFLLDNKEN